MKFTVDWLPTADRALIDLWTSPAKRAAVTNAADRIDLLLRNDPHMKATPVDTFFFLRFEPLVVLLDINLEARLVQVIDVRFVDP